MAITNKTAPIYSYSLCHNVDGINGFFVLKNREHLCETLADAVALADRFNEVTKSKAAYRATATKTYEGGCVESVVYKTIGVSPDGQPHDYLLFSEFPVMWITEETFDALATEWGAGSKFELLSANDAAYFCFTPEKSKAYYGAMNDKYNNAASL